MATTKAEPAKPERIEVKRAALAAKEYFHSLYPTIYNSSLEEVELSEDGKYWLITLGFQPPKGNPVLDPPTSFDSIFGPPKAKYKVFRVDARTGEVTAMKIRSFG
jgi:hypothetical protein